MAVYCKRCNREFSSIENLHNGYCSTCQIVTKQDELIQAIDNSQSSYETGYSCVKCGHPISDEAKLCPNCGDHDAGRKAVELKLAQNKYRESEVASKKQEEKIKENKATSLSLSLTELENREERIKKLQKELDHISLTDYLGLGLLMYLPAICSIIMFFRFPSSGNAAFAIFLAIPVVNWFVVAGALIFTSSDFLYKFIFTFLILAVAWMPVGFLLYKMRVKKRISSINELRRSIGQ